MTSDALRERGPTIVDRGYQLAYASAYRLVRSYWKLRHPTTHGTLVVMINEGEVLLVKNSYVPYFSAPGGYVHSGESSRTAVKRELLEETGVVVTEDELVPALDVTHEWEGKLDHVELFTLQVSTRPRIAIDHREVVEARWVTPAVALGLNLFPPLRTVIESLPR